MQMYKVHERINELKILAGSRVAVTVHARVYHDEAEFVHTMI